MSPRPHRGRAVLLRLLLAVVALLVIGFAAGGWYYSDQLLPAPVAGPPDLDAAAIAGVIGDEVLLPAEGDADTDGVFGMHYPNGFARLGSITSHDGSTVTRRYEVVQGTPPQPGSGFALTTTVHPEDPGSLALAWDEVAVPCPLGTCPAWYVPGDDDTWAVLVHGRGSDRSEVLRSLDVIAELGLPALVISYRNDGTGPATDDGVGHFGAEEWHDLEAATDHALDAGAEDLLLVGYSQGGSLVTSWLLRSDRAGRAVGAILDAPLLGMDATLELQAQQRGLPQPVIRPLLAATKAISQLRAGVAFDELEHVARADDLDVPILLFHGTADQDVPVATSDELAAARPDLVTYLRADGVGHVRSWNADPDAYEDAVRRFVREHALD